MIQSAITVCCAFLSFFLAETYIETSGVLAVMTSGLMVAFLGWPRFVSKECISVVWEFTEFLGNTLIFLLAGLLFGHCVFSRKHSISLGWADLGWLFAVYGAVMVIRGVVFIFFWPSLNCVGNRVHWQEVAVMIWSGLRGAVGLTLAIVADCNMARVSEHETKEGSQIMFLVGGTAMLTIIINATLAGPLLRCLGFTDATEIEQEIVAHTAADADAKVRSHLDELLSRSEDIRFKGANSELVRQLVPILSSHADENDDIHVKPLSRVATEEITAQEFHDSELKACREMFVRVVRHKYWQDMSMKQRRAPQIMFLVGGMAMLTIIINATLAGPLLRCLGFTDATEIEKEILAHAAAEADAEVCSHLDELLSRSEDIRFKRANSELVKKLVPTLSSYEDEDEDDDIHVKPMLGRVATREITAQQLQDSELKPCREMFVRVVRHKSYKGDHSPAAPGLRAQALPRDVCACCAAQVLAGQEGGIIPRSARVARNLLSSTDAALENAHVELGDWEMIEESLLEQRHVPFLACLFSCWPLSEVALIHELCPSRHRSTLWEAYTALSFVETHRAAREELFVHLKPGNIFSKDVQASVLQESEEQCRFATDFLLRMPSEDVQVARSHMLAGRLLVVQSERINHLKEGGILDEKGAAKLLGRLQDARRDVARTATGITMPMMIKTNRL
eukprot:CAMPEP_0172937368 /NCGR_PEP_ID=MMETSP1075-20121228/222487_1 /TAXON_ID=2916 /ORGANISM="Ceratium fusus, Strain PA161109" /LENGTH=678 /DNA_ID=CAMNT_0013798743 /DNA_START=18 /DNA_END=2054 /DNA_ORIENTATION=-